MDNSFKSKALMAIERVMKSNCKNTSFLLSEALDHEVSVFKRFRIKLHLSFCQACRYYLEHLKTIKLVCKKIGREDYSENGTISLSEARKEKIRLMLKK